MLFDRQLDVYLWFLWSRIIAGKLVIFVTDEAPDWKIVKEIPAIKAANVTGMYKLF